MNFNKVIGYGVVSDCRVNKKDRKNFNRENTNVYRKTKKLLTEIGYPDAEIYIDIIHSYNREKPEFKKMYNDLTIGDLVVTFSVSFLGDGDEIAENYAGIVGHAPMKSADILIPDTENGGVSKFSTVYMNLESRRDKMDFPVLIDELTNTIQKSYKKLHGRAGYDITEDFVNAYWLYERFKISIERACEMANIGQTTFYSFLKRYESSPEYIKRLLVEEEKYQISKKPKRYGKVPKKLVAVIAAVDQGMPLDLACIQNGLESLNPIDYERYKLKYMGGRKALAEAIEY